MHIFCDESGFTGNHLLDSEQQVFTYATVAIEPGEAQDLIENLRAKHRLMAGELKGGDLVKQSRGKHAITDLLETLQGRFRFTSHLKPYALAAKLFEYIFEPAFSRCNSIFYGIEFHLFISTLLFTFFRALDSDTNDLLANFSAFAKKGDVSALQAMFPPNANVSYEDNPLHAIGLFAQLHREKIAAEVLGFREPGIPNWMLDLTTTSLFSLLASWGETYPSLDVTCDEAKPLKGDLPLFDSMVGRTDKFSTTFRNRERPMTFNLSKPIVLAKSHEVSGLQLADCVAASAGCVWRETYANSISEQSREWKELLLGGVHEDSMWPDYRNMDLGNPSAFANTLVLKSLVERSLKGEDLCKGIYDLHRWAVSKHADFERFAHRN